MPLSTGDITEIINLAHEYNQAIDRHDPEASTRTWTAEGELRGPFGDPNGRQEILAWISVNRGVHREGDQRHQALLLLRDQNR